MLKWREVLDLAKNGNPDPEIKVVKTAAEWKQQLTPEEFHVTREAGTERAFSSEMCSRFDPGIYACVCCGTVLFDASEKFESGSGWPSFTQPASPAGYFVPLRQRFRDAPRRDPLQYLRRSPGTCVSGWPAAQRPALLHECACPEKDVGALKRLPR